MLELADQVAGDEERVGVSSAMIPISVGPASRSMPTRPNTCRLASTTYALPGPTTMSTAARPGSTPKAIAAIACTPPSAYTASAPARCAAYSTAGWTRPSLGGVHTTTRSTPATRAGTTFM